MLATGVNAIRHPSPTWERGRAVCPTRCARRGNASETALPGPLLGSARATGRRAFGPNRRPRPVKGRLANAYDGAPESLAGTVEPFGRDDYPELEPAHATTTIAMARGEAMASRPAPMRRVILRIVGSFPVVGADERFERRGSRTRKRG